MYCEWRTDELGVGVLTRLFKSSCCRKWHKLLEI